MGRHARQNGPGGADSHKALARRHQRVVQRYAPLMAGLLLTGCFALLIFSETFCGPATYHRYDRRDRDNGVSTAVAHAVTAVFHGVGASDSVICFVFAAIALGSFLALACIALMLWRMRPTKPTNQLPRN
jgi:hypothetical protein